MMEKSPPAPSWQGLVWTSNEGAPRGVVWESCEELLAGTTVFFVCISSQGRKERSKGCE